MGRRGHLVRQSEAGKARKWRKEEARGEGRMAGSWRSHRAREEGEEVKERKVRWRDEVNGGKEAWREGGNGLVRDSKSNRNRFLRLIHRRIGIRINSLLYVSEATRSILIHECINSLS